MHRTILNAGGRARWLSAAEIHGEEGIIPDCRQMRIKLVSQTLHASMF
jgi:hypothetical protein